MGITVGLYLQKLGYGVPTTTVNHSRDPPFFFPLLCIFNHIQPAKNSLVPSTEERVKRATADLFISDLFFIADRVADGVADDSLGSHGCAEAYFA